MVPRLNLTKVHLREPPDREHPQVPADWPLKLCVPLEQHHVGRSNPPGPDGPGCSPVRCSSSSSSSSGQCGSGQGVSLPAAAHSQGAWSPASSFSSTSSTSSSTSTSTSTSTSAAKRTSTRVHRSTNTRQPWRTSPTPPPTPLLYKRLEQATTHTQLLAALQALPIAQGPHHGHAHHAHHHHAHRAHHAADEIH